MMMFRKFFSDKNEFYKSSLAFLGDFYKDSIRNVIRILRGYKVILQDFFKDSKTNFQKGCCRDSEGL